MIQLSAPGSDYTGMNNTIAEARKNSVRIDKPAAVCRLRLVWILSLICQIFCTGLWSITAISNESGLTEKYGLYASSSDSGWRDPCKISYAILALKSTLVNNRKYVLITKHSQLAYLRQLKQKYSVHGQDYPDGRVKLESCRRNPKAASSLDIIVPELSYQSPAAEKNGSAAKQKGFYVSLSLRLLPQGFWPYSVKVINHAGETYVRDRQIQCAYGPLFKSVALKWHDDLKKSRELVLRLLADRVANSHNRFVNQTEKCVVKPGKL